MNNRLNTTGPGLAVAGLTYGTLPRDEWGLPPSPIRLRESEAPLAGSKMVLAHFQFDP